LTQENQDGNQNASYYQSHMMVGAEHGYSPIEKYYLALIFAVKKLRHYMLAHKAILISKVDPLKYLMTQPILTGRLAKWAIILIDFDITYMPQKAIKGQALVDFLAAHPIQDNSPLKCDFPDEETLHIKKRKSYMGAVL
jgi:RNase H-like domain found in reverse transcriptase